jgi:hypothetical protein
MKTRKRGFHPKEKPVTHLGQATSLVGIFSMDRTNFF